MHLETLTLRTVEARPVLLKLERPIVARIATMTDWPLILIDVHTEEGIVGRSCLEPYVPKAMRYLVPALHDLGTLLKGRVIAPIGIYEASRKSLHFVGGQPGTLSPRLRGCRYRAAWRHARARACLQQQWLLAARAADIPEEAIARRDEGGFERLKLRLGRERATDDLATIDAVRAAVGEDMKRMVDSNQGLHFGGALERCHALDDLGLAWIEEPVVYDNLDGYRSARLLWSPGSVPRLAEV